MAHDRERHGYDRLQHLGRHTSLLAYVGHSAYGLDALRWDLDRFAFLLGGDNGENFPTQPDNGPG